MTAKHGPGRRPVRIILARAALVLWLTICGLAVLLFGGTGLDAIFDPNATDRGSQLLGSIVLVVIALLVAVPPLNLLRGAGSRRFRRGRVVVRGQPPMADRPLRSRHLRTPNQRKPAVDNTTGPALARLTDAERALGEALYQLDLRRAELEIPRDVVVDARAAALATAAALRRWTQDAPVTRTRYEVARPIDRGALAIKRLTSAVEAVLAGDGSLERVRTATGEVAEAAG